MNHDEIVKDINEDINPRSNPVSKFSGSLFQDLLGEGLTQGLCDFDKIIKIYMKDGMEKWRL